MPEVRDGVDALLLGCFLLGLLLAVAFFVIGGDLDAGESGEPGDSPLPFGVGAVLVALAWFGGVGYLLRWAAGWPVPVALPAAALVGGLAGAVVQRVVKFFGRASNGNLRPEDFRLPGTLGHVALPIRVGGVGEVIYEQGGVRHVVAARAADGEAIAQGTEVVVLKVDRGTAAVEPFEPLLAGDEDRSFQPPVVPMSLTD